MYLARTVGGQFLGDLEAGVAAADDQHAPREILRPAVVTAVHVHHAWTEAFGELGGHARRLEGAGRDDDLSRLVGPVIQLDEVTVLGLAKCAYGTVELDGEIEAAGV